MAGGVLAGLANVRSQVTPPVSRLLCALLIAAGALQPIAAFAIPIPSPSLSEILLPPPSDYAESGANAPFHGSFTSSVYATAWGTKAAEAHTALEADGFVEGYGFTWINQLDKRALIEFVVAFAGGQGARNWLTFAEAGDKADPTYQHADTASGIDPYYGEHNAYPSHDVSDAFAFVKGNDFFVIGFESTQDDVLNLAQTRAKNQYNAAPDSTIPRDQWPENAKATASPRSTGFPAGGYVFVAALLIGLLAVVVVFARQSRHRGATMSGDVQMSPDGASWWDGQKWHDAQQEVPFTARRSPDGAFWWDGQRWRPVPQ